MPLLLFFVAFVVLAIVSPALAKFSAGAIVGFCFGGFAWVIACFAFPSLFTLATFGWMVVFGMIITCIIFSR